MTKRIHKPALTAFFIAVLAALSLLFPNPIYAQEEVASTIRRYKDREVSTGYYEEFEVMPGRQQPLFTSPPGLSRTFLLSPTAARVRIRTRLADSHMGIKFYAVLRCEYCHVEQTKDIHTVRANLTCRQCHGGEPVASIEHANSLMNPIRRHSYVCAKCHEGSSASFATYVVHQPAPESLTAKRQFPLLYYAYWFMLVLLVGTLAFFLPHTFLVGFRELFSRLKEKKIDAQSDVEHEAEDEITRVDTEDVEAAQRDIEHEPEDEIPPVGTEDVDRNDDRDDNRKD